METLQDLQDLYLRTRDTMSEEEFRQVAKENYYSDEDVNRVLSANRNLDREPVKQPQPVQQAQRGGQDLSSVLKKFKEKGIDKATAYQAVREEIRNYLAGKGRTDLSDQDLDSLMESEGFNRQINTFYGVSDPNTRWNQEAAQYGEGYSKYLKDRYELMLESQEGREEFQNFARDRLQATDDQINQFMSTLDKDTKDETWRKYLRAVSEGANEFTTGLARTASDVAGLFGLDPFNKEQLDKDAGDLKYIEEYSEAKHDMGTTGLKYLFSPEAARNFTNLGLSLATDYALGKTALKSVSGVKGGLGMAAKGLAYIAPSAAVGYAQERGTENVEDAALWGAGMGALGGALGGAFETGKAIKDTFGTKALSEKFVKGLEANPQEFEIVDEAMRKASNLGLRIPRSMLPNQIAFEELARASLRNIGFRKAGSKRVDYNSALLFKALMEDLDKAGKQLDHNQIGDEFKRLVNMAKDPEREIYSSIRNTFGHRGLYQGPEFGEAMEAYFRDNTKAVKTSEMQKITDYIKQQGISTYDDGESILKALRDPETKDFILASINNQAKKDYADMFEEHILRKSLPDEAANLMKEAGKAWSASKKMDDQFKAVQNYFTKEADQARELFPRSVNDAKYETKLGALQAMTDIAKASGREDLVQGLANNYVRRIVGESLEATGDMQGTVHPVQRVGKAFEKMDDKVLDILLPADKAKEFKAYGYLFKSMAHEANKFKAKGGTLGQVFDMVGYAATQAMIAPTSFVFSKAANADATKYIREALDKVKQGKPGEALKATEKLFPEVSKRIDETFTVKGETGEDKVVAYRRNKQAMHIGQKAGIQEPEMLRAQPGEGLEEVVYDASKVATPATIQRLNPKLSMKKALASPIILRGLKSKGYEAVRLSDGSVLDLRNQAFNPTIAEQRQQIQSVIDINKSITPPKKVTKKPLVKDSSQPTPDNIIDTKSGELVENAPKPEPLLDLNKLTKEQKASLRRMDQLRKTAAKIADLPDKSKKTAKYLNNRYNHLIAQIKKNEDLKKLANDEALRDEWEKTVMAFENARINIREAQQALEESTKKKLAREADNAAKGQKTKKKNEDKEIMEQNTNLETQDYSRFTAENNLKHKTIDTQYKEFEETKNAPKPADKFTLNKKEKPKKEKAKPAEKPKPKQVEKPKQNAVEKPKQVEKSKQNAVEEPKPKERNKYAYAEDTAPVPYNDKTPDAYVLPDLKELRNTNISDEQAAVIQKALDSNEWEAGTANRSNAVMALRSYKLRQYKMDLMSRGDARDIDASEWKRLTQGGGANIEATPKDFGGGDSGAQKQFYYRNMEKGTLQDLYYMIAKNPENHNMSHDEVLKEAEELYSKYMHEYSSASPSSLSDDLRKRKSKGDDKWTGD